MMISLVTLFPELYEPFFKTSLIKRAIGKGIIEINLRNIFDYVDAKKRIDSPTFGPGSGMLLKPDVVQKAIEDQENKFGPAFKIFFSPQGKKLDQALLKDLSCKITASVAPAGENLDKFHLMLLPARYEGMDSRVEEHYADCIISIGDFVLMGGDLPAMILIEGLLRLIPGVVAKAESIEQESFSGSTGRAPFVDYPEYTEPVVWQGLKVPDIVRSGDHKKIENWRREMAIKKTILCHFDWLKSHVIKPEDIKDVQQFLPSHYVVLMHSEVLLEGGRVGTSSVTSLDIHDIARSAYTFGLKKYFLVTPLEDQQKIIKKLLDFWSDNKGIEYNIDRAKAIENVQFLSNLDNVIEIIEKMHGVKPILIGTTARSFIEKEFITYNDQEKVWKLGRPILFLFGTARGLAQSLIDRCDFLLEPIKGFSSFNHLSVRSAAAIVFDRWLGINIATNAKVLIKKCELN